MYTGPADTAVGKVQRVPATPYLELTPKPRPDPTFAGLKAVYSTDPFIHTDTPLQVVTLPFKPFSMIPGSLILDGHMVVGNLSPAQSNHTH